MTKYRFLSVLTKQDLKPIKASFTNPFKNKFIKERGDWRFNLRGAYYFSKTIGESSMWLKYREWLRENDQRSKKYPDEPPKEDEWLDSKDYYYADIDLEAKGIYVINTPTELREFFIKYGIINRIPFHGPYDISSKDFKKAEDLRKINLILYNYLRNLQKDEKELLNFDNFYKIKEKRNRKKVSLVKINKGEIIIDKRKTRFGFLIDIHRTIDYNDKIISNLTLFNSTYKNRYKLHMMNKIFINYLDHLSSADKAMLDNIAIVNSVKNNRNLRNLSLVKVNDDKIIVDKRKTHFEFLIDIIRTIEYNDKIVGDSSDISHRTVLDMVDYTKLLSDGYNGLYYSDKLVRVNPKIAEEDLNYEMDYKYVDKIDIGDFPDILGDTSIEDRIEMKNNIEDFIRWLGCDTLLVWKWIFD
jgi:hypothetical protein